MTKSSKSLLVACSLILAALVLNAGAAMACTQQCVHVEGQRPLCRQCTDTGVYTGITCGQSGACGCFFTVNTCGQLVSGIQAQPDLAALNVPADKGAACSAAPVSESTLLDSLAR